MSLACPSLRPLAYRRLLGLSLLVGLCVTALVVYLGGPRSTADSLRRLLRFDVVLLLVGATVTNVGPGNTSNVFDVRFLPNPFFVPELKALTGRDPRVADFVLKRPETETFLQKLSDLCQFLLPHFQR
jgi:hypothetical protein